MNHKWEHTRSGYGPETNEYISAMYKQYITMDNEWTRNSSKDEYPYTQLRKLIQGN